MGLLQYAHPGLAIGLQDESFPAGRQFLHFFALSLTGLVFVAGYLRRWRATPHTSATMYAVLACLCFIEVMDFGAFGGGAMAVPIMLTEFALYLALSVYLRFSPAAQDAFPARL
ncbi:hypothetical protein JI664_07025 [Rhodobacter sp. NTK016B]|uniref:hypothetical protein n=1 Tax=Rhodobacter sp. NTK016B TaxID=2759676 RepID=UPI001A9067C8|nr:hypothetical protein [Rhodobacter sp. NTK016B]MBN8291711.1 hypothetical protein [Rhodobacter sp. NTK016B]